MSSRVSGARSCSARTASDMRCVKRVSRRSARVSPEASEVDAVYVGWHPDCGMKDIESACHAIWAGAKLYVASDVPFFATKQGRTIGYTYAIVGAIRRVTRSSHHPHGQAIAARVAVRRQATGRAGARDRRRGR